MIIMKKKVGKESDLSRLLCLEAKFVFLSRILKKFQHGNTGWGQGVGGGPLGQVSQRKLATSFSLEFQFSKSSRMLYLTPWALSTETCVVPFHQGILLRMFM